MKWGEIKWENGFNLRRVKAHTHFKENNVSNVLGPLKFGDDKCKT